MNEKNVLEADLKVKADSIVMLKGQITTLNQQILNLKQTIQKNAKVAAETTAFNEIIQGKDQIIEALKGEVETKLDQLDESSKTIMNLKSEIDGMRAKLNDSNVKTPTNEISDRYYPVREVKQKMTTFMNFRFLKNRFNEYGPQNPKTPKPQNP